MALQVELPAVMTARLPGLQDAEAEVIAEAGVPAHLKAAMRERLERCSRQQAALLRLASLPDHDFGELTRNLLRRDAETLGVARVSYWTLDDEGKSIVCQALYDQTRGGFESGLELTAADYPKYFEALVRCALIPAHDAVTAPSSRRASPSSPRRCTPRSTTSSRSLSPRTRRTASPPPLISRRPCAAPP